MLKFIFFNSYNYPSTSVPHIQTSWPSIHTHTHTHTRTYVYINLHPCNRYYIPLCPSGPFLWMLRFPPFVWFVYLMWCCSLVCIFLCFHRNTFSVDPDTHIDSIEQAEEIVLEGTSKWSCKIAITGTTACRIRNHAATILWSMSRANRLDGESHETCTSYLLF